MNLLLPISQSVIAGVGVTLGALLCVAYLLKLRRRRFEVPFSQLWQRVLAERDSSSLWRKLQRLFSLLLQLVFVALLLGATLDPRLGLAGPSAQHMVLVIDASASMQARDDGPGKPPRLAKAKEVARALLSGMGDGDAAMIVRMDGQSTALSRFESDVPRLGQVVSSIGASDTPADLGRALAAAADALRDRPNPLIVLIGDGVYAEDAKQRVTRDPKADPKLSQIDLSGIEVRFVPVGRTSTNLGIVAFNVRRYVQNKLSYEVLLDIQNFTASPETLRLTLYSGTEAIDVQTFPLAAGERARKIYPDRGGGDDRALRAHIERMSSDGRVLPADAFPLDDTAWALLPARKKQKVLLVSQDNLYLEGALLLDANIHVDKLAPRAYEALAEDVAASYDVIVYDGHMPAGLPPSRAAVYFRPLPEGSPFPIHGEVARPFITEVALDHPVTRWVTLSDVNIDRTSVFSPQPGDVVLARAIRDPLLICGKRQGKKLLAFGFGLDGTDLMLRVAFPVLMVNALDWFAGDDAELITTYRTGTTWRIPVDAQKGLTSVTVVGPDGRAIPAPVLYGRASFYGQKVGVYRIQAGDDTFELAANLADPTESNIGPGFELILGGKPLAGAPSFQPSVTRELWIYLVIGALLLSALEWVTYHRRLTV